MHGVAVRLTRTVLPRGLKNPPSPSGYARLLVGRHPTLLVPAVCGEEGPIDRALRAATHVLGDNWTATVEGSRESVFEPRGNAQPEYPLRGFPRL
jgi:hypothetical protein